MVARVVCLVALCLAGCDRGSSLRQASVPTVADHPDLAKFVGEWDGAEGIELTVARNADGSATVSLPSSAVWTAVVNNVRLEGTSLKFDCYMYHTDPQTGRDGGNPYSGVRNEVTLTPGPDADTLRERWVPHNGTDPVESTLRRHRVDSGGPGSS